MREWWQWVTENAAGIQALAAMLTFGLATLAAWFGWRQLNEAATLRREQAQPYVAAGMRVVGTSSFVEFYLRNFGATAAFNVRLKIDPPMQAAWLGRATEDVKLFDVLPTMAPGEEWATLWGHGGAHFEQGLPDKTTVAITYEDSLGRGQRATYVLDWAAQGGRRYVAEKGLNEIAKTLAEIGKDTHAVVRGSSVILSQTPEAYRTAQIQQRREWEAGRQPPAAEQPLTPQLPAWLRVLALLGRPLNGLRARQSAEDIGDA